jgi:hypothetical protein
MDVETRDRKSSSCGHHQKFLSIQNLFNRRGVWLCTLTSSSEEKARAKYTRGPIALFKSILVSIIVNGVE